jgi:hypothetical protein
VGAGGQSTLVVPKNVAVLANGGVVRHSFPALGPSLQTGAVTQGPFPDPQSPFDAQRSRLTPQKPPHTGHGLFAVPIVREYVRERWGARTVDSPVSTFTVPTTSSLKIVTLQTLTPPDATGFGGATSVVTHESPTPSHTGSSGWFGSHFF